MPDNSFQQTASDGAIESHTQDKFDREDFAGHLAKGILARRKQNSFVVSLQGAWGCGKSSIKNMAVEKLEEQNAALEIVQFEPWQLRDADSLFAAFFGEIALKIGGNGDEAAESQRRLLTYSKSLELGGSVVKAIGALASVFEVPGGKLMETIGEKMGGAAEIAKQGAEVTLEKSLRDQKRELGELLRKLDRPILVIIDDIDRLEVEEMLLIFQLIKANADFPNFTYLLLMHRERVQQALSDRLGSYGSDYLEKIVQLPIDVPPTNSAQRYALLKGRIAELLESWKVKFSEAEQSDLAVLWQSGLSELLPNPRDVVRALNAIEFSLAIMKNGNELEVNLADFVALESLRITEATTYTRLPMVKPFLTQNRPQKPSEQSSANYAVPNSQPTEEEQPGEAEMNAALKELANAEEQGKIQAQAARRVLQFMFPRAVWALGVQKRPTWEVIPTRPETRWKIRDENYFDRYFVLSIPQDQVSQAEVTRFLQALPNRDELISQLEDLERRGLHQTFLLELRHHFSDVPSEHHPQLLAALLDFWEIRDHSALEVVFQGVFLEIPDVERRGDLFYAVLEKSRAYAIPSLLLQKQRKFLDNLNDMRRQFGPHQRSDHRHWSTEEQWEKMRDLIVERIRLLAPTPEFWKSPLAFNAVLLWHTAEPDEVKRWVSQQSATDEQLPLFLSRFAYGDFRHATGDIVFFSELFEWIEDVVAFRARVESFDTSKVDGDYEIFFKSFLVFSQQWLQKQAEVQSATGKDAD